MWHFRTKTPTTHGADSEYIFIARSHLDMTIMGCEVEHTLLGVFRDVKQANNACRIYLHQNCEEEYKTALQRDQHGCLYSKEIEMVDRGHISVRVERYPLAPAHNAPPAASSALPPPALSRALPPPPASDPVVPPAKRKRSDHSEREYIIID